MSRRNVTPDVNDPAIKLFGRSISFPDSQAPPPENEDVEDTPELPPPPASDSPDTSPAAIKTQEEPCTIEDSDNEDGAPTSEDPDTVSSAQENAEAAEKNSDPSKAAFKKPDKILPCPRCNSMDTKFCYFNNYNVNQPRHFCRSCQRYWTAGGAIRNVPVGAGRRKSKHASSQLQPVVIPSNGGCVMPANLINSTDLHCMTSSETGEVLTVNPDSPLYRSVANKLTVKEPENILEASKVACGARAGFPSPSCSSMRENEASHETMQLEKVASSDGRLAPLHNLQGFPGPPPYPWNFGWNGMAYGGAPSNAFLVPWNSPTMMMTPGFCMPNITFPFVPPMGWAWNAAPGNPASSSGNNDCSGNTSPLGKHSRDLNLQVEEKNEKNLWIPKTLRIDDPEAAAKSSIWSTLGITPGKNKPITKGGMFKAFQSQTEGNAEKSESDRALQANPAAFSRSKAFQESA